MHDKVLGDDYCKISLITRYRIPATLTMSSPRHCLSGEGYQVYMVYWYRISYVVAYLHHASIPRISSLLRLFVVVTSLRLRISRLETHVPPAPRASPMESTTSLGFYCIVTNLATLLILSQRLDLPKSKSKTFAKAHLHNRTSAPNSLNLPYH